MTGLLLLLCMLAGPETSAAPASTDQGSVTSVRAGSAYLDRGRDDGLTVGLELTLSRDGLPAGSCRVEWVGDHHASCQGPGLRVGDAFTLARAPEPPEAPARSAPSAPAELARRHAALESAPQPLLEFKAEDSGTTPKGEARVGHTSWSTTNADSSFHQERADVSLRGLPVSGRLRMYLDATALAWTGRPEQYRALARTTAQLYVREGELVSREAGQSLALAVGRVWPWFVPGVAVFDGAQVGWRSERGDLEVGGFGGGVPDPVTLSPSIDRLAVGAYLAGRHAGGGGQALRLLEYEARASFMSAPEYSKRLELEGRASALLGYTTSVDLSARVGLGDAMAPAGVDAVRVDVEHRPSEDWRLSGSLRYDGALALDVPPLDGLNLGTRALRGDLTSTWRITPGFSAGLSGLLTRDLETAIGRQLVGPDLSFPHLFGARGGLSLGYLEEFGWQKGRSAYVQTVLQPSGAVHVLGRLSYFEDTSPSSLSDAVPGRDVGLYTSTEYSPTRWLSLRVSLLARLGANPAAPFGLTGNASVGGNF